MRDQTGTQHLSQRKARATNRVGEKTSMVEPSRSFHGSDLINTELNETLLKKRCNGFGVHHATI